MTIAYVSELLFLFYLWSCAYSKNPCGQRNEVSTAPCMLMLRAHPQIHTSSTITITLHQKQQRPLD